MVLEELLIELDVVLPLIRGLVLGEDRLDRADRLAGAAVDALLGVDVQHLVTLVNAVNRADLHAGLVLHADARLGNDVGHRILPRGGRSKRRYVPRSLDAERPAPDRSTSTMRWTPCQARRTRFNLAVRLPFSSFRGFGARRHRRSAIAHPHPERAFIRR